MAVSNSGNVSSLYLARISTQIDSLDIVLAGEFMNNYRGNRHVGYAMSWIEAVFGTRVIAKKEEYWELAAIGSELV